MSQTYEGGAVTVFATGVTVATGAATARTTIPNTSAGVLPRYIRVAAINESYVRLGDVTVVATANDMLVQPADSVLMAVNGATNIAYIQGTAAGKVNVVALENS